MRKILWFTLGFGAACAFCAYGKPPVLLTVPALVLLVAFFAGKKRMYPILLTLFGIAAGTVWFSRFEARTLLPVYALDGITQDAAIRCTGFPEETDYGCRGEGVIRIGEKDYRVVCYLDEGNGIQPGSILSGSFLFRVTSPGGLKESNASSSRW